MNANQTESHRNEGNDKVKAAAEKVTEDESTEHTEKTGKQSGKHKTVLAELNDDPKDEKKDSK